MRPPLLLLTILLVGALYAPAEEWRDLFNGQDLAGWEVRGDGIWTVTDEGVLVGQRKAGGIGDLEFPLAKKDYHAWFYNQAWLYTVDEFDEYDLHIEWWLPFGGNSGISLRDQTRAADAITIPANWRRTPSRVAYEIQISNGYPDKNPSGSIYSLAPAKNGPLRQNQWNTFDVESRRDGIRVKLNGELVATHPGDPERPATGPIGLQLHDQKSVAQFRNLRIRIVQ